MKFCGKKKLVHHSAAICTRATFRTRTAQEVREITARAVADLGTFLRTGELPLPIDRIFGFDQLGEAFSRMRANQHFGKIIVSMQAEAISARV